MIALVLWVGASSGFAQNGVPYNALDAVALEARILQLEEEMKKKADRVDTRRVFDYRITGRAFFEVVAFDDPNNKWYDPTPFSGQGNILGIRDAQLDVSGTGYEIFDYRVELALNNPNPEFRCAFTTDFFLPVFPVGCVENCRSPKRFVSFVNVL